MWGEGQYVQPEILPCQKDSTDAVCLPCPRQAQNRRASTVVRAQGPVAPESIERCRDILTEFLHSSVDHAQSLMKVSTCVLYTAVLDESEHSCTVYIYSSP